MVDGGSNHNFLQSKVVSVLNLQVYSKKQFDFMVGNREVLKCEGLCSAVLVQIQNHVFLVDFYILPMQGADVIFRVQSLQLLGPIMVDYQKLTMDFDWEDEHIYLQGERQLSQQVSMNQLRRLQHTCSMFHITMLNNSATDSQQEVQTDIQRLRNLRVFLLSLLHYHHTGS